MFNGLQNRRMTIGPRGVVVVLFLAVCVVFEFSSRGKKIEDLTSQNISHQRKIKDLELKVQDAEREQMNRFIQQGLLRKMCEEMGGYENLPGGKWHLYKPYEYMPGQEDIVICLQGNEPRNAIPPIVSTN